MVKGQLAAAHGIDHDAGRVGRIVDLELELHIERNVAEALAFQPDQRPLAVLQPGHVVAGSDVHVVGADVVVELRGHRACLGDLLGHQPLALEHVEKVGVTTEVELVGAVEAHATLAIKARQSAVHDGGSHLRLDVIADDRQAVLLEALLPVVLARDEDRNAVDEGHPGGQGLLHVPLGGFFRPHREVVDEHVGAGLLEDVDDVRGFARRLLDQVGEVLADPVVGHPALDLDAQGRHVGEFDSVVLTRPDRLGKIFANLGLVDVEGGHELDVANVVPAEVDVHQPRHEVLRRCVFVVLHALDQGGRAVADADDGDADFAVAAGAAIAVLHRHALFHLAIFCLSRWSICSSSRSS